jgi:hypothetical protein
MAMKKSNKVATKSTVKAKKSRPSRANKNVVEDFKLTQDEWDAITQLHMVKPAFCSFVYLLNSGFTVGQLASALEEHGVWGWDQFGRYKRFQGIEGSSNPKPEEGAPSALKALADVYQDQLSTPAGKLFSWADYFANPAHPIHFFGWPSDALPEFKNANDLNPMQEPTVDSPITIKTLQTTIGLLLSVVLGNDKWPRHQSIKDQKALVSQLNAYVVRTRRTDKGVNTRGLGVSNLEKIFAAARKLTKQ